MKGILKDMRGVSPIIGVLLMVAITVILAAILAAFVFGFGTPAKPPPIEAQLKDHSEALDLDEVNHVAVLSVGGGDLIPKDDLIAYITYTDETNTSQIVTLDGGHWVDGAGVAMTPPYLILNWSDEDDSGTLNALDRIFFIENSLNNEVKVESLFNLKLIHKPANAVMLDLTVLVS